MMEIIQKLYSDWYQCEKESWGDEQEQEKFDENISNQDKKFAFLASSIFDLVTYDLDLDIEFGRDIFNIIEVIYNKKNFEYTENKDNYKKFIIVCNILHMNDWINWGTSIRGCWFDVNENTFITINGIYRILMSKEFIESFIRFIKQ